MSEQIKKIIPYTNQDYGTIKDSMIKSIPLLVPEYTDLSESDPGVVLIELLSKAFDILSWKIDIAINEALPFSSLSRKVVLKQCKWVGYKPGQNKSAKAEFTVVVINDGIQFTIPKGTQITSEEDSEGNLVVFETDESLLVVPPIGLEVGETFEVSVVASHGVTVEEVIGVSNGEPNQKFKITQTPYVEGSLIITTKYKSGATEIQEVFNETSGHVMMLDSDKLFVLDFDHNGIGTIEFGDGVNGYIPRTDASIVAKYRIGGGEVGNVTIGSVDILLSNLEGRVESFKNTTIGIGGKEQEDIDSIKKKAPYYKKTGDRLVIVEDFESFAMLDREVEDAKLIEHPTLIDTYNLYVKPSTKELLVLDESFKSNLRNEVLKRSLIGINVFVLDPVYVNIKIEIDVTLNDDTFIQEVVSSALKSEIINLKDSKKFGSEFYVSDLYFLIDVDRTSIKKITPKKLCRKAEDVLGDVVVQQNEIINIDDLDLDIIINFL